MDTSNSSWEAMISRGEEYAALALIQNGKIVGGRFYLEATWDPNTVVSIWETLGMRMGQGFDIIKVNNKIIEILTESQFIVDRPQTEFFFFTSAEYQERIHQICG